MAEPIKIEQWAEIKRFPNYTISNWGRIKRITPYKTTKVGHILKPKKDKLGYLQLALSQNNNRKTILIHQLVLEVFICSRPKGKQCNHKDGNKSNNHIENLEWITASENVKHSFDVLGRKSVCGEQHGNSKLTENDVYNIRKMYATGLYSQHELARRFNVKVGAINPIVRYINWKHI